MKPKPSKKTFLRSLATGTLMLASAFAGQVMGQSRESVWCGTRPTQAQIAHMEATRAARQNYNASNHRGTIRWVPVTWHLFRTTAGTGGMAVSSIPAVMRKLNEEFAGANIQFYTCGAPKEIRDDAYFTLLSNAEAATYGAANDVANTMNVYVVNQSEVVGSGGYAYFPGGPERVVIGASNVGGGIFIHEVGHFFALYHTHGDDKGYEGFFNIAELVNGTNCHYAGDDVCDTPADPGLTGRTSSCVYTGTVLDPNGQPYTPMVENFMSYAPAGCLTRFTPGQYNHMAYAAVYERPNLGCASNPAPCATPVTAFPYNQGFEGGSLNDWAQGLGDDFNWTLTNAATPTANTGPDAAQSGNYFAFIEATGNNPFKTAELYSGCFDLTYTTSPELTFWYHMFGNQCGSLTVQTSTDAGASWTNAFYKYGNQGNAWTQATVDLKQHVNQTFFRVRFVVGTETGGDLGDIAIDNIDLHSKTCSGTTASVSHTDISCQHTSTGSVSTSVSGSSGPWTYLWSTGATTSSISALPSDAYKVTVTNSLGCQTTLGAFVNETIFRIDKLDMTPATVYTTADGALNIGITGGVAPYSLTWTYLDDNTTATITGITGSNYNITGLLYGDYRIEVTDAIGCRQGITNLRVGTYACALLGTVATLPYSEGFEAGTGMWFLTCATSDNYDWVRNTGSTPQANTGPDAASEGSWYAYSDAANNGGGTLARLLGPQMDLTSVGRATITFKYHQYGANCDKLELRTVSPHLPPGTLNTLLWAGPTGDQGNVWKSGAADLKPIAGTNHWYLFFNAYGPTAGGTTGEIAIDDIQIFDCSGTTVTRNLTNISCLGADGGAGISLSGAGAPYTYLWSNGATTASISSLAAGTYTVTATASNGCVFTESFTVAQNLMIASTKVTPQAVIGSNDGAIDLTVNYGVTPYTYLWSNGATTQDLVNLAPGTYTVTVTDARGCTVNEAATVSSGTCLDYVNTFPYNESFEGTTLGAWSNVTGDNFDWTGPFTGATPTAGTGPDVAADGSKYLYTEADPSNYPSKTAWLVSKCFDLSAASAATFTFKYHLYTTKASNMGSLSLQASSDNGVTWSSNLFSVSGDLGNTWQSGSVSLNTYAGKAVKLRFTGTTGNGNRADRGLDQFAITITPLKTGPEAPGTQMGSNLLSEVSVFPNPTTGAFTLTYEAASEEAVSIRMVDVTGKVVSSQLMNCNIGRNQIECNPGAQAAGMYFVEISAGDSKVVKRLIITE